VTQSQSQAAGALAADFIAHCRYCAPHAVKLLSKNGIEARSRLQTGSRINDNGIFYTQPTHSHLQIMVSEKTESQPYADVIFIRPIGLRHQQALQCFMFL